MKWTCRDLSLRSIDRVCHSCGKEFVNSEELNSFPVSSTILAGGENRKSKK